MRQPKAAVRMPAKGAKTACPMGLPVSARPSIRPRVSGNQGARVAVMEKEEMAVCPMPAKML